MGFGLRNAAQTFQRTIDQKWRDLKLLFTYLDDSRIGSKTAAEHLEHLDQFFAMLAANGLTINLSKCTFIVPELEVLGHIINKSGTTPTPQHIQVIIEYPPPQDAKQLQRYLGMVNFYRRFTPGITAVLEPLTAALKGGKKTLECSAANRFSPRRCRWHTPHQTPPSPWQRMHPTPTSVAPSNNRHRGPGKRWVSFLASYSLQNRNIQRLTGNSWPPSPPYDISGTSWRDAISSCGRTIDHWSQHSHVLQNCGQPDSSDTWPPSPNLLRTLGTSRDRRTWWQMPCPDPPLPCRCRPRRRWRQKLTICIYRNWRRRPQRKLTPLTFRTWPPNRLLARRSNGSSPAAAH